jgi:ParB-like chromosome segregation protein Spo0J
MPEFKPKIEMVPVSKLTPYARNSRTHSTGQIEKIAQSIRTFGFLNPILVANTGEVVAGHGRLRAAIKLNMEKVPCIKIEHLTREQWSTYVIADNRLTDLSGWDEEILGLELKDLKALGVDLGLTFLSEIEIIQLVDLKETEVLTPTPGDAEKAGLDKKKKVESPSVDATHATNGHGSDTAAPDPGPGDSQSFSVMAYCESYSQQLDAMNAMRALGIKCAAK